jgi:phosphoribosylanthranilate isomerase
MRTVKVKICGITCKEDLQMACSLGADAVGFVVGAPYSPRNLTLERAERLIRMVPSHVKSVLVTVPKSLEEMVQLYNRLKPDAIQIHGNGVQQFPALRNLFPNVCLIRAAAIECPVMLDKVVDESKFFNALLVDTYVPGKHGGTGVAHDWNLSRHVREAVYPKPLILAGGLNPENVGRAIYTVRPYAVDVSTGVESRPGVKDPKKVEAFIREAKSVALEDDYGGVRVYGG